MNQTIYNELKGFETFLRESEKAGGTIEKYIRDVRMFIGWLGCEVLCKERVIDWKESLVKNGYEPVTINSMLSALNSFFKFIGRTDCCVRFLKIQRKLYRSEDRELTKDEYLRLIRAAEEKGDERMVLLLETICATGIRVSEVKYITVEAAGYGIAEISLKGKIRTIILPGKLCKKLWKYARKRKIASGEIFLTGSGKALNRKQIWASMKALCNAAGVDSSKVFPHNLRHLFARTFYKISRDTMTPLLSAMIKAGLLHTSGQSRIAAITGILYLAGSLFSWYNLTDSKTRRNDRMGMMLIYLIYD